MVKRMYWVWMVVLSLFIFAGCAPKDIVTETGNEIPKSLKQTSDFLFYSNQLSEVTAGLTNDLLESGDISLEEKERVKEVWVEHKKYHNLLQTEVIEWYRQVNKGNTDFEIGDVIITYMKNVVEDSDLLMKSLSKVIDEDIDIPDSLIVNMYNLYEIIKEKN